MLSQDPKKKSKLASRLTRSTWGGTGLRGCLCDKPRTGQTGPTLCARRARDGGFHFGIFQHQVLAVWSVKSGLYTLKGLLPTIGVLFLWAGLHLSPPPQTPKSSSSPGEPRDELGLAVPQRPPGEDSRKAPSPTPGHLLLLFTKSLRGRISFGQDAQRSY